MRWRGGRKLRGTFFFFLDLRFVEGGFFLGGWRWEGVGGEAKKGRSWGGG